MIVLQSIFGVLVILSVPALGIYSSVVMMSIVDAVNSKGLQQFSLSFIDPSKRRKLFACYQQLYPDGKLIVRYQLVVAAFAILLISLAAILLFLARTR